MGRGGVNVDEVCYATTIINNCQKYVQVRSTMRHRQTMKHKRMTKHKQTTEHKQTTKHKQTGTNYVCSILSTTQISVRLRQSISAESPYTGEGRETLTSGAYLDFARSVGPYLRDPSRVRKQQRAFDRQCSLSQDEWDWAHKKCNASQQGRCPSRVERVEHLTSKKLPRMQSY